MLLCQAGVKGFWQARLLPSRDRTTGAASTAGLSMRVCVDANFDSLLVRHKLRCPG